MRHATADNTRKGLELGHEGEERKERTVVSFPRLGEAGDKAREERSVTDACHSASGECGRRGGAIRVEQERTQSDPAAPVCSHSAHHTLLPPVAGALLGVPSLTASTGAAAACPMTPFQDASSAAFALCAAVCCCWNAQ